MKNICPGRDIGQRKPEEVVSYEKCPNCDYEIEFFYDDIFRKCGSCEAIVQKSEEGILRDFRCAVWCGVAEKCLGSDLYKEFEKFKRKS
tara:strand:- start:816 stop:1082 length:267 start_codon:yes stop_codon:yes gene_type:complete